LRKGSGFMSHHLKRASPPRDEEKVGAKSRS
jgi:hypothetical protein